VLICIGQMLVASPVIANSFDRDGVFAQTGKQFSDFRPIPKWSNLLERFAIEERRDQDCRRRGASHCPYDRWKRAIDSLKFKSKAAQVRGVNEFANQWRYVADTTNWDQEDYWAIPGEFFRKAGDCEDFAFVKFMSLRALGFTNDELRLVVVEDLKLNTQHAVTLVELNGRVVQLDNQIDQVVPAKTIRHYKPIYAANEHAWWLYP
jgi:predicted transglutaminase-like cysteine proteinase